MTHENIRHIAVSDFFLSGCTLQWLALLAFETDGKMAGHLSI
jgi:hypothetical protein